MFFGDRQGENENERITDSMMVRRTIRTVLVLVICLAAMSFTAYAYFHYNTTSASNVIESADYSIGVTVKQGGAALPNEPDNVYTLGADSYTVELSADGSAKNGFCIVYVRFDDKTVKYHTQQLVTGGHENNMTFDLDLQGITGVNSFEVEFVGHWGTSSVYGYGNQDGNPLYIRDGLTVSVAAGMTVQTNSENENENKNDNGNNDDQNGENVSEPDVDPEQNETQAGDNETEYIVVSGDTLTVIAQRFGTTVEAIVERNSLPDKNLIVVGQRLIIPAAN